MTTAPQQAPLLNVPEVARRLNISTTSTRRRIASGQIPAVRIGALVRIDADDLEQYLADSLIAKGAARR